MVISDSPSAPPAERERSVRNAYIAIYVLATCTASVILSITGHIPLNPIMAILVGLIAGFAMVFVQLTYVKFIVKTSWRIRGKHLDQPRQQDNNEIGP
ncbi:MAG: hypothetical protein ACFFDM_04500 [Candidatus Thorarchaeota archaeon]